MANKTSTSKQRIAEMMKILNIKQIDIVNKTGIPKSSLSNYLSGKRTPNQKQLSVISDPYGINPAWLMGYDVPMWIKDIPTTPDPYVDFESNWYDLVGEETPTPLSLEENILIECYRKSETSVKETIKRALSYYEYYERLKKNEE